MTPIRTRKLDAFFAVTLVIFAITSFAFDAFGALGIDWRNTSHPFGPAMVRFGESIDRIYLMTDSIWIRVMLAFSAFVFGPLKLLLAVGLWKDWPWIRGPGLVVLGAYAYSTLLYTAVALWGPAPSLQPLALICINAPYAVIPAWLAVHLIRKDRAPERS